jgi:hypothetical protein
MTNISRRTLFNRTLLLAAAGGGAAIGLTKTVHHRVAVPPAAPPAALAAALDTQQRLLGGYDAALAANPGHATLTALRADIAAHGAALRAVLEDYPGWRYAQSRPSATPTAATSPVAGSAAALAAASKAAAATASKACLSWPAGEPQAARVVPLLGCIAACLTTHAGVLS